MKKNCFAVRMEWVNVEKVQLYPCLDACLFGFGLVNFLSILSQEGSNGLFNPS